MYNAWRKQTADVSVIHNYIDNKKWVGWAWKAQMANALSLFQ